MRKPVRIILFSVMMLSYVTGTVAGGQIAPVKSAGRVIFHAGKLLDVRSGKTLTDQAIVNILKQNGVQIARRTVAKYRDQLGVLSARMRKRV